MFAEHLHLHTCSVLQYQFMRCCGVAHSLKCITIRFLKYDKAQQNKTTYISGFKNALI